MHDKGRDLIAQERSQDVDPGCAAINGFQNARAVVAVPREVFLAGAHVYGVRLVGIERDGAVGQRHLIVGERGPVDAAVGGFPDAAFGRSDIDDIVVARIYGDGIDAAGGGPHGAAVGGPRTDQGPVGGIDGRHGAQVLACGSRQKGLALEARQRISARNLQHRVAARAGRNGREWEGTLVVEPGLARGGVVVLVAFPVLGGKNQANREKG